MSRIFELALPHLQNLHAYTPGQQPTEPGWVKLNTNECPYAPSPKVAEAIRAELGAEGATLRLYPNPKSTELRSALGKLHGMREKNVCVGNGSDDILSLLARTFGGEKPTGFTFPSYSLYPVLVGLNGGKSETIEFDRTMRLPVEKIAASNAQIFFLTSPNAPTGVGFTKNEIAEAARHFRGILVVDEAYALFAREDAVSLIEQYENLVVVRTLSKAYALAGIRVGYALAHPPVIELLDRVRDSYNVSRLSQVGALAAISDTAYYSGIAEKIKATRDLYAENWRSRFSWFVYPSQANFLFVEPMNRRGEIGPAVAKNVYDALLNKKILVRYFPSHALTDSFLRISVGSNEEMLLVNDTFDAWRKNG